MEGQGRSEARMGPMASWGVRTNRGGMAGIGANSRARQFSAVLALSFLTAMALMVVNVAASMAGPPPGNWSLTFDEEFNSAGLNTSMWTPGWQRNEVSEISERCVSPQFVSQPGDGYLHLSVQQTLPCGPRGLQETGAAVESNHGDGVAGHVGYSYSYGYVEWRVYLPGQANTGCPSGGCIGNWPALWTLPESHSSEIDVMEGLEKGLACYHFLPPFTGNEQHGACLANSYVGWHTFGADWEPSGVTYYYDGTAVGAEQSSGNSPSPEYLVMDVLPSRTTAPKLLNQAVLVDYVHVYQQLPIVTTGAATGKQPLQATLNGTVNPNGTPLSNCHFDYGTSTSYGSSAPCSGPESGERATVSLTPGTTYHFRIVATNSSGPAYGNDETFTTPGPVDAVTGAATSVQEEQATLNGTVNPRGYDAKYHFQYGTSTSYTSSTSEGDAGAGSSPEPENATITGLQPGTTYHYRLVATSGGVTSEGHDQTFRSLSRPSMVVSNGTPGAATQGVNGALYMTTADFAQNTWQSALLASSSAMYSAPSSVADSGGNVWIAFEGPANSLRIGGDRVSGGWSPSYEGPAGTTYSAPSVRIDSSGNVWVFAEGSNHTLAAAEWVKSRGVWETSTPLSAADVYSAPSIAADSGGDVWVAFEGPSNALWVGLHRSNGEWGMSYQGPSGTTHSAPSEAIDSANNLWVFAEGPNNTLTHAKLSVPSYTWEASTVVSAADVYSAPSVALDSGGTPWVAFEGPGNSLWDGVDRVGGWSTSYQGAGGTTYSAPSEGIDSANNVWVGAQGSGNSLDVTVYLKSSSIWEGSYQGG